MKNTSLVTFVAFSSFMFSAVSCKKIEAIKRHNIINETCCRVERVTLLTYDKDTLKANFLYNSLGDPVSVAYEKSKVPGIFYGLNNLLFKYDLLNRLSVITKLDPLTEKIRQIENLTYLGENMIIDSSYAHIPGTGDPSGDELSYGGREIFTLDNSGRVIVEDFQIPGWNIVNRYYYNADGNLILHPGGTEHYDDAINIHRTNKVWKFLDRDYSINNSTETVPAGYNEYKLPVQLAPKPYVYEYFNYPGLARLVSAWPMDIKYSCDSTGKYF